MIAPRPSRLLPTLSGGLRVPRLSKAGAVVVVLGLHADLAGHWMARGATTAGEHVAHLVVLVGMVLVLAGIVADGSRAGRGRRDRPEGSDFHAVR